MAGTPDNSPTVALGNSETIQPKAEPTVERAVVPVSLRPRFPGVQLARLVSKQLDENTASGQPRAGEERSVVDKQAVEENPMAALSKNLEWTIARATRGDLAAALSGLSAVTKDADREGIDLSSGQPKAKLDELKGIARAVTIPNVLKREAEEAKSGNTEWRYQSLKDIVAFAELNGLKLTPGQAKECQQIMQTAVTASVKNDFDQLAEHAKNGASTKVETLIQRLNGIEGRPDITVAGNEPIKMGLTAEQRLKMKSLWKQSKLKETENLLEGGELGKAGGALGEVMYYVEKGKMHLAPEEAQRWKNAKFGQIEQSLKKDDSALTGKALADLLRHVKKGSLELSPEEQGRWKDAKFKQVEQALTKNDFATTNGALSDVMRYVRNREIELSPEEQGRWKAALLKQVDQAIEKKDFARANSALASAMWQSGYGSVEFSPEEKEICKNKLFELAEGFIKKDVQKTSTVTSSIMDYAAKGLIELSDDDKLRWVSAKIGEGEKHTRGKQPERAAGTLAEIERAVDSGGIILSEEQRARWKEIMYAQAQRFANRGDFIKTASVLSGIEAKGASGIVTLGPEVDGTRMSAIRESAKTHYVSEGINEVEKLLGKDLEDKALRKFQSLERFVRENGVLLSPEQIEKMSLLFDKLLPDHKSLYE